MVGSGFPGWIDVGNGGGGGLWGSWMWMSSGAGVPLTTLEGVAERWSGGRGVSVLVFFEACSTRAAARAGILLFLSMLAMNFFPAFEDQGSLTSRVVGAV